MPAPLMPPPTTIRSQSRAASSGSAASRHVAFQLGIIETLEEAVASEPFINAIAFSVCLMRVKDGTDIDELKAEIRRSANPAKWICVDVNPNDVRVESVGDLVLLIMADDSEKYSEAFYALAE
mgnify:CR=1 FL=1